MSLGPFWCQRDNSWVRFIVAAGEIKAIVAQRSPENPQITTDWKLAETDSWPTSYEAGKSEVTTTFYVLKGGRLYSTGGMANGVRGLLAREYRQSESDWYSYNIARGNPFEGIEFTPEMGVCSFAALPLTPEMQEARRLQQEEEEQRRREEDARRWLEIQQGDIRRDRVAAVIGFSPVFVPEAYPDLYENFRVVLQYAPINSPNCADYLRNLKAIIEDNTDRRHQRIIDEASKTYFNTDQGFGSEPEITQLLFQHKKLFFFNVLREEALYLSQRFQIPCDIMSVEALAEREEAQRRDAAGSSARITVDFPVSDWQLAGQSDLVFPEEGGILDASQGAPPDAPLFSREGYDENEAMSWAMQDSLVTSQNILGSQEDLMMEILQASFQAEYARALKKVGLNSAENRQAMLDAGYSFESLQSNELPRIQSDLNKLLWGYCQPKLTQLKTVIQGYQKDGAKHAAIFQHASELYKRLEVLSRTLEVKDDPRNFLRILAVVLKALPTSNNTPNKADIEALIALGEQAQGHPSPGKQKAGKIMMVLGVTVAITIGIVLGVTTIGLASPLGITLVAVGLAGCAGLLTGFGLFRAGKGRTGLSNELISLASDIKETQPSVKVS